MKRTTVKTFLVLTFSMLLASPCHAKWVEIASNTMGSILYVDSDRIREHNGYIYYWVLSDHVEPQVGFMSNRAYIKLDCSILRYKKLQSTFHVEAMGHGTGETITHTGEDAEWKYPLPDSVIETVSKQVCDFVG